MHCDVTHSKIFHDSRELSSHTAKKKKHRYFFFVTDINYCTVQSQGNPTDDTAMIRYCSAVKCDDSAMCIIQL